MMVNTIRMTTRPISADTGAVEAANADLFADISRLQISAHDCGGQISEHPPENYN
jgi:hypothetical protein